MGNKFKLTLLAAGLGRKKLTFGNRDDAPTFKRKMEDAYPKLKEKLLQASSSTPYVYYAYVSYACSNLILFHINSLI